MNKLTNWHERIPDLAGPVRLDIAGFDEEVTLTAKQLGDVFLPLLSVFQEASQKGRVLAAVCGIPAGGKTTFAASLRHLADLLIAPGAMQVVSMDAWHLPNATLDARMTRDAQGRSIPLRQRKGGPESYDIDAMLAALTQLRESSAPVSLPVYDRRIHEPRPGGVTIAPETRIVVVEGNYVLGGVRNAPAWDLLAAMLTPRLFIQCDPIVARNRMIDRHIRGGIPQADAIRKYESNDQINTRLILDASSYADYQVFAFLDTQPGLSVWPPFPSEDSA